MLYFHKNSAPSHVHVAQKKDKSNETLALSYEFLWRFIRVYLSVKFTTFDSRNLNQSKNLSMSQLYIGTIKRYNYTTKLNEVA